MVKKPLLMNLKPLWLREKIYWKLYYKNAEKYGELFENASLEFAPQIQLQLMPSDVGHKHLALTGFIERDVTLRMAKLAKLGGLMVDVGANYGYFSCLWASADVNNRVIAFEASPNNINPLQNNISRNKLEEQITLKNCAVGKEKGILPFTFGSSEKQSGWGGILKENEKGDCEVDVISLDDYFSSQEQNLVINALKIDVEGGDTLVIQGAKKLLKNQRIKHIFFEENLERMGKLGIESGIAQSLLLDCGYKLEKLGKGEFYATV